jgi:transposase
LPGILATRSDALSPRMLRILEDLSADWRRLDARIEGLSSEIETLARQDKGCERPTLKLRYLSEMTQPDT